ncbi:hypothetical protein FVE85_0805 [Porphyridium purpureum]|uniref:Magnesium transporter NIPA8 n=1 Tax=Porphyridium purpureum TaxID=35688 RepID=A0A5J4Z0C1_PORPP|nr:hypothetical protein FVE85_0805 [Porphyridium purpureum]|eukprot:POR8529..scf208_2
MAGGATTIGLVVGILAKLTGALGANLQRKHHVVQALLGGDADAARTREWQSKTWLLGLALFFASQALNGVSLALVSTILLAPLNGLGVVFNAYFAVILSGETFDLLDSIGTGLVAFGAVILSVWGNLDTDRWITAQALLDTARSPTVQAWLVGTWIFQAALLVAAYSMRKQVYRTPSTNFFIGSAYAVVTSTFSTQSLVISKCGAVLLRKAVQGDDHDGSGSPAWLPGVILGLIGMYGAINILLSNEMMRFYDIKVLSPLSFSVFTISNTGNAFIIFRAGELVSFNDVVGLALGIAAVLLGVLCLTWSRDRALATPAEKHRILKTATE